MNLNIKIVHPKVGKEWKLPTYAHSGDVGLDLVAAIDEPVVLYAGSRVLIPAGFSMELEEGYEAQIRSRSGLAIKNGIAVLNSPGTIDSSFRGQVCVILINTDQSKPYTINPGDKIAQMVINKVEIVNINVSDDLSQTDRAEKGFGSTGLR
jgi:dUTP pyrophosphatase